MPPLVSIITLSYNYGRYIEQAIQSVLAQSYPHWQLVVVDDASQDDSLEVIRRFDDPRILVLPLATHQGASNAYNAAYAQCRGSYIGTVDADDRYAPDKLQRQVALLEARPDVDVVGTWIVQIDEDAREVENGVNAVAVNQHRNLNALDVWATGCLLTHSSALIRKSTHDRVGGLTPRLHLAPDFELWLRFLAHDARFHVIPEPLTVYRHHTGNLSHNHDRCEMWLERCFLFAAHLVPLLRRRGRQDLLPSAWAPLTWQMGDTSLAFRMFVFRRLAQSASWPREYGAFREWLVSDIEAQHGDDWARLARTPTPTPTPAPVRPSSASPRGALSIVDDYFPNLVTGFRLAEFNWYLEHLDCVVYSRNPDFDRLWRDYAAVHPHLADRVQRFDPERATDCALLYCVFLNNAYELLPLAEMARLPMLFTLYPGSGFQLSHGPSDLMLSRVMHSPWVRRVIVTQQVTRDYLLDNGFAEPHQLDFIWGVPTQDPSRPSMVRRRWPDEKPTFDIGFAALKYMPGGIDKGYDTFVTVARRLGALDASFRFHVAGSFGPGDAHVGTLGERITFHGIQPAHRLSHYFAGIDLMLSPNVPYLLKPGSFDGFPTATCIEAALNGVAVLCTDPFSENSAGRFVPDAELGIIDANADAIVERIMSLRDHPERLHRMASGGQARSRELYGIGAQLAPRLALLTEHLSLARASLVAS